MLTLVDTSVWIHHFRTDCPQLHQLLEADSVLCHPLIIGELACGHLRHRLQILESLSALPSTPVIEYEEILGFIDTHRLFGQGLGWVDVHLLVATLVHQTTIWTHDQPLQRAARKLRCSLEL